MSDTIYHVVGLEEIPYPEKMESGYAPKEVYFTKFAGGIHRGRSLQITIGNEHVQLNHLQTEVLAELLKEYWLDE